MTQMLLLIDDKPKQFAPLADHLRSIGYRMKIGDNKMSADEQIIRTRPHAVLLRKRNEAARERIQSNMRVADVPVVMVEAGRRHIEENVGQIQTALISAAMRRLR